MYQGKLGLKEKKRTINPDEKIQWPSTGLQSIIPKKQEGVGYVAIQPKSPIKL